MQNFKHPNIISIVEFLESNSWYYIIQPLCDGGDMQTHIDRKGRGFHFNEEESILYLKQICSGFQELQAMSIMHRDFKLQNIFLKDGRIIIGDFGAAKELKYKMTMGRTFVGNYYYSAPEVLTCQDGISIKEYDSKCDIWSIGVAYYTLLFGAPPFNGSGPQILEVIEKESGNNLKFLDNQHKISDFSKDLLRKMLEQDPKKRIDWPDLFAHKIFTADIEPDVWESHLLDDPLEDNKKSSVVKKPSISTEEKKMID